MRITELPFERTTASESILAQASGRGNLVKDSVLIHTAAVSKSPGQALNRSDTEIRNTDPRALREKTIR